ncbi:ADP-ribose pyrophosphatase [Neorhizobium sp. SOG26]|uniref:NUDIX domain-containing protein n=1 Tax=Neorhizobium sp. SOG26 TaxID=2060726 RepID=UPI000E581A5C|nr:NUDIX domain-containing protein [Neorhizobium sp. SOG26]AXV14918.1 ADP-ribose pyrophosphatase [Neorhizobium sp. SOG26]
MTDANDRVKIVGETTLSDGWTRLSDFEIDYTDQRGETQRLKREIYHRGEAAAILLHDPERDKVVLVKQFRLPAHLLGDPSWMIEVPAGLLDSDRPEEAIRREALEETGYKLRDVRFLFRVYMSPGAITERVHFFYGLISQSDKTEEGGGLAEEHEDIEVLQVTVSDAMAMIERGEICDAKTIMLLQWLQLNRGSLG